MRRWSVRFCLAGAFALLVSLVLAAPIPLLDETFAEDAAVDLVDVPPLGVTGAPKGEELRSEQLSGDVLTEPPSDAVPVAESWATRLRREQASAGAPAAVGFDEALSTEVPAERTAFGTTFDNVDGTKTSVIDDHLVHYLVDGQWQPIDPRVVETRDGVWSTTANDRVATFSSDAIELAFGDERIRWAPVGVKLPEPAVSADGLTVTYANVWPGVDLRYRLETDMVIEEIVISNAASVPADGAFAFEVTGPGVKVTDDGMLSLEGALADDMSFGVVEVLDRNGSPISTPQDVSLTISDRRAGGDDEVVDTLKIAIDPTWASRLPSSVFPLIVDPTTSWGATTQNATSHIGSSCSTNPLCSKARVGNAYAGGNNQYWHTGLGFNYSAYLPTSTVASQLTAAALHLGYYSGVTSGSAGDHDRGKPVAAHYRCDCDRHELDAIGGRDRTS